MQVDVPGPSESALLDALRQAQSLAISDGDGALTTTEICNAFNLDSLREGDRRRVHILLHKLQQNGVDIETVYVNRPTLLGVRPTPGYRIKQSTIDNMPTEC